MKTVTTTRSHFNKYSEIVSKKSRLSIPATKEVIIQMIESGDEHLSSIPLKEWDYYAHSVGATRWEGGKGYKSLSEQVCTLKHYAIFHVAKYKPVFKD